MGPELGLLLKQTECEAGNQFGIFKSLPRGSQCDVCTSQGGGGQESHAVTVSRL